MRTMEAVHRLLDWLEPPSTRVRYQAPPGAGNLDTWVLGLFLPVALFTALVFAVPFTVAPGSTGDLSGRVGSIENAGVWGGFPEPAQWVYHLGDIACHTKAARSLVIGGNQMPFCARDVAIFLGLTAGLGLCVRPAGRVYPWVVMLPWWSYLALLAPVAIDGGAQDFLGFESDNVRRILTGFPAGLAVAFSLVFIVYEGRFARERVRANKRRRSTTTGGPPLQAEAPSGDSVSTGSLGSKAVESAPTEKKNPLHP